MWTGGTALGLGLTAALTALVLGRRQRALERRASARSRQAWMQATLQLLAAGTATVVTAHLD